MADVKRICTMCGSDRTQAGEGIAEVRDFRGRAFALVGSCCADEVNRMLQKLCNKYGGYSDATGSILAAPRGTPTIRDVTHLREEIGEAA